MKQDNTRLTIEDVEKIQQLYKNGYNYSQIGRLMNPPRHHTTIMLLLRRLKNPIYRVNYSSTNKPINKLKDGAVLVEIIKISGKCLYCGKMRIGKWKDTNYCSRECWHTDLEKRGTYL